MKLELNKHEIKCLKQALIVREMNIRGILNSEEEKGIKDEALYRSFKKKLADTINLKLKIEKREYEEYNKSENVSDK